MSECFYITSATGSRLIGSVGPDGKQVGVSIFNYLKAFDPVTYDHVTAAVGTPDSGSFSYASAGGGTGTITFTQDSCADSVTNLSLESGAEIAAAILAVWAVGYGFRVLIRHLKTVDEGNSNETL